MPLVLRSVKGSPLTVAEVDGNFSYLDETKVSASGTAVSGYVLSSTGVSGVATWVNATEVSGLSGYSGYSGTNGASGYSGTNGASGASGYSGFSGRSGYSGFSGISGYSGTAANLSAGTAITLTPSGGTTSVAFNGQLANSAVTGFKTATFNSQNTIATTTGAITVDWTVAQNQKQNEPTGTITYTFTAPPGPCHLQLIIDSDGTSTAQTINWPASVVWMGSTWSGVANKKAVINFWYDGTNYFAVGTNQV